MPGWLHAPDFSDATVRMVLLGAALIGGTSGLLGAFAVLRKRSLVGDALAHAALPGVALAFLITGSKALPVLLVGAAATGVLGVLLIQFIVYHTRIKPDSAIGIVLSVFFGIGIVLLTHIQHTGAGNQSGLDKFLFGQAAAIVQADLEVMCALSLLVILTVLLFYKEFKCLIFDPDFLTSLGYSARRVDLVLMGLIVLTVMVGLQAVGVILIAAMLITPAVAARFWTDRLGRMITISILIGVVSGGAGAWVSSLAPRIPTGPVMVLIATACFLVSAAAAPRGFLARWRSRRHNERRENRQHFLRAFLELEERSGGREIFRIEEIARELKQPPGEVGKLGRRLKRAGLVRMEDDEVALTPRGQEEALFVLKSHRLWEYYLVYRSILEKDQVDRPADEVEHILTPEIIERLEEVLAREQVLDVERVVNIHRTKSEYREKNKRWVT